MSTYVKAFGWAAVIILIAIASRAGFFGEEVADWLMMATLVVWASTSFPRNCAGRTSQGN
jgi:hypothetical protein